MSSRSTRHTPATPPPVPKRKPTVPIARRSSPRKLGTTGDTHRTSPRKLGTTGGGKGTSTQKKVSNKKCIRKTQSVKANLKDNRSKKTQAPAPVVKKVVNEEEEKAAAELRRAAAEMIDRELYEDLCRPHSDDDEDDDADEDSKEDEDDIDEDAVDEDDIDDAEDDGSDFEEVVEEEEDDSCDDDDEEVETTARRHGTKGSFSRRKSTGREKQGPRSTMVVEPTDCQTARKSATRPESSAGVVADTTYQLVHPYTANQSALLREPHVTSRLRSYVKNVMFRTVKFVNTDKMIARAMETLFKFENVREEKRMQFHMLYECVFNDALNTKRSACEQNGGMIVRKMLETMDDPNELFTVDELCKLRRATTEREKQAFFWFFGTFLQSVCGAKAWGKTKFTTLISKATLSNARGSGKVVTPSDEAFGLLLYENYVEKWIAMAADEKKKPAAAAEAEQGNRNKKKGTERRRGKYTGAESKSGRQCKFGGWSADGIRRFNALYAMALEDRESPNAMAMEREFLEFCNSKAPSGDDGGALGQGEEGVAKVITTFEPPVEAMWDDMEEV